MTTIPLPPEDPHVKGGNATLKLYSVAHFQRMGRLSAAKRKQLMGINERPVLTQKENQAQRVTCKEDNE